MREKSNTICFSGHRDISNVTYKELMERLDPYVERFVRVGGFTNFICGGALGFDTFAAMYVLSLRKKNPDIKLILMIPCRDQDKKWGQYDKRVYKYIINRADEVIYLADKYYNGCMQKRNRAMVDQSSICICYLEAPGGSGTRQTVNYATEKGLTILNIAKEIW